MDHSFLEPTRGSGFAFKRGEAYPSGIFKVKKGAPILRSEKKKDILIASDRELTRPEEGTKLRKRATHEERNAPAHQEGKSSLELNE